MHTEGHAQLYGPGRTDGPFPEHYEPMETPLKTNPLSKTLNNPIALQFKEEYKAVADPKFPIVCTTFRVTEHWQTGLMTRNTPWLVEAHPQMFCELSPEFAKTLGVKNGEKITVESVRGSMWAVALVTERIRPLKVAGKLTHQVGLSWQFGWIAPKNGGDSANLLTPSVGDANTGIPETKSFMVNVRKA
jgi:formate dehydrogenase major subunit